MAGKYSIVTGGAGQLNIVGEDGSVLGEIEGRDAVAIEEEPYTRAREYPLGFDSVQLIAAGATLPVVTQPQIPFRVERLVIPSDIGGLYATEEVSVGKNPQFAATDVAVPARTFDEQAVGVSMRGDTGQVSQNVTLRMNNFGGAPNRFRATIIGTALEL